MDSIIYEKIKHEQKRWPVTESLGTPMPLEKSSTQICVSLYKFDLHEYMVPPNLN